MFLGEPVHNDLVELRQGQFFIIGDCCFEGCDEVLWSSDSKSCLQELHISSDGDTITMSVGDFDALDGDGEEGEGEESHLRSKLKSFYLIIVFAKSAAFIPDLT